MHGLILALLLASSGDAPKPIVSVLYFDNATGQPDFEVMRKGLADMLITDLVAWDGVTVVEREKLESALTEIKLQKTKAFDQSTAIKVGRFMGARYLLTGTISLPGKELQLDARLIDAQRNEVLIAGRSRGPRDDIFALEQKLVEQVTSGIDLKVGDVNSRKKAKVPNTEALLAYSKAVDLSDQGKLEEAQAAIQALVSASPTFLMARDRKQEIIKRLEDSQKKRLFMLTNAAKAVAVQVDAVLKTGPIEKLPTEKLNEFIAMRAVKGLFLARSLREFLVGSNPALIKQGSEVDALQLMMLWFENQQKLIAEQAFVKQATGYLSGWSSDTDLYHQLEQTHFLSSEATTPGELALLQFLALGWLNDGNGGFQLGPTLGDLKPHLLSSALEQQKKNIDATIAQLPKLDGTARRSTESELESAMVRRAEILEKLQRDDEAAAAYQLLIDTLPLSTGAHSAERSIRLIVGAERDNSRDKRERWVKALAECDDMDLRVGIDVLENRLVHSGFAGYDQVWAQVEKACKPNKKNRGGLAYVNSTIALSAGAHDDCARFRSYFSRYLELGGSLGDMLGYQKNYVPQCDLREVLKSLGWWNMKLDETANLEFTENLTSVLSRDETTLSLHGRGRAINQDETFFVQLKNSPAGFKCTHMQWARGDDDRLESDDCAVTFEKFAAETGEYDIGTISGSFKDPRFKRTVKVSGGFKLKRHWMATLSMLTLLIASAAPPEKPVISVLYFDNQTGKADFDVLRKGLADMVITDLVAWDEVSVVEREKLEAALGEIKLQKTRAFDQATAVKVGRFLGARYLLKGSITLPDGTLQLEAQLVDLQNNTVVVSARARGPRDEVFNAEQTLVSQLTAGIQLKVAPATARNRAKVPNLESLLAYSRAIDLSDQGDVTAAQEAMKRLVKGSPLFPMAREKREALVKRLAEHAEGQRDAAAEALAKLQPLVERTLEKPERFSSLTATEQHTFIAARVLNGLLILRATARHLSPGERRVVLPGHELAALTALKMWVRNQQQLAQELALLNESPSSISLTGELRSLLTTTRLLEPPDHDLPIPRAPEIELLTFVARGEVNTGARRENIAPILGLVQPTTLASALELTEQRVQELLKRRTTVAAVYRPQVETRIADLLNARGDALAFLYRDDEAATEYQRVLELFPTTAAANPATRALSVIAGTTSDTTREDLATWAAELKSCGALNSGSTSRAVHERLRRYGLAGLDQFASEFESACRVTPQNVSLFHTVYRYLADAAGEAGDCERALRYQHDAARVDPLIKSPRGPSPQVAPRLTGCDPKDSERNLVSFTGSLGKTPVDFDDSIITWDYGDRLVLVARAQSGLALDVTVSRDAKGTLRDKECRLKTIDGASHDGTCTTTFTKLTTFPAGIDEGTFGATFADSTPPFSGGIFKARRQR